MPIAARKNTVSENETPIDSTKYNQEIDNIYTVLNQVLKFYASATSPANPQANQTWLDTKTTPALLRRFDGTVWRWTGMYVGTTIPSNPIAGAIFIHGTSGAISTYTGSAWLPLGAEGVVFDPTGTILTATDVDAAIKELIVDYQAAEAAKEEALGAASNAGTYMGQAQSAKTAAETAQGRAQVARTGAETAQGAAVVARDLAQKWASKVEDTPVSGGEYSAKHYAAKAAESAASADHSVKASSTDETPGYLDAKVDGTTLEVSGDKLAVKSTFLATTSDAGLVELATDAEFDTGSDTERYASVAQIRQMRTGWKNLLINGNFDVWQRGDSISGLNKYTADMWKLSDAGGASSTVEKKQAFVDGAYVNVARATRTEAVLGNFRTVVDEWRHLSGKTLTLSFWARGINAGFTTGTYILAYYGVSGSESDNLLIESTVITTDWQKFVYTFAVPDLSDKTFGVSNWIEINLFRGVTASQTIEISQVQLEIGSCATPFEQRPYGLELALCQRYCWVPNIPANKSITIRESNHSDAIAYFNIEPPQPMRAAPTMSNVSAGYNIAILSYPSGSVQSGFSFALSAAMGGEQIRITATKSAHGLTDSYLQLYTNPPVFSAEL